MKYIIKNCYAINGFYTCTSCVEKCKNVNCLLKKIVEECKSETELPLKMRGDLAERILSMLEIEEIKE